MDNARSQISLLWYKRDLRVTDHAPLTEAVRAQHPILPIYIFEQDYWSLPDVSRRHWWFIRDSLRDLRADLKALGLPLLLKKAEVLQAFEEVNRQFEITCIYAHEETGNAWTFQRDLSVHQWCRERKIAFRESPSNGVVRCLKRRDDWSKIRNQRMQQTPLPRPEKLLDQLAIFERLNMGALPPREDPFFSEPLAQTVNVEKGGRREGEKVLDSFLNQRAMKYLATLSGPSESDRHCSRLSSHIAYGTLSMKEVLWALAERRAELDFQPSPSPWKKNLSAFGSRLAWRCHFVQKLEDQPSIETHCMHPAFEGMRESEFNECFFNAWKKGRTGYPFVDACMRSLETTGWINFRMRAMLVSFASYHLWLDWRRTAPHLAKLFTDYEPGIHYSQFQMQSGVTGINTLRIYSPVKQSLEHDPDGVFIRKWVPELKQVTGQWVHEPWKMPPELQEQNMCVIVEDYPLPIVDHTNAIKAARQKIGEVRRSEHFRQESEKVYQKLGSRKRPHRSSQTAKKRSTSNKRASKNSSSDQLNLDI